MKKAKEPSYSQVRQKTDRYEKLPVANLAAAGIDVGSTSNFVGIGQKKEDVKEFGVSMNICMHFVSIW